jgi:hypothetical protein
VIAGKPLSLRSSKPIIVKNLGDFFVTDAVVRQFENPADHARSRIVNDRPTDRADPFLTFSFFDYFSTIPVGRPENEKSLSNPFPQAFSYFSG